MRRVVLPAVVAASLLAGCTTATAPLDECATADLRLTGPRPKGAGQTQYWTFGLRNAGTTRCTLYGFPGVSVLDASGRIVQQPARRDSTLVAGDDHGPRE